VLSSGTIAFRDISNADVNSSKTGTLADMAYSGNNTFRLNSASNTLTSDQAYTFATGLGAANYTRLELMNGATYRGGTVTVDSGGSLVTTNGANTIGGDLVMQAGATLSLDLASTNDYSRLIVQGNANFGGATLAVTLRGALELMDSYRIVESTGLGTLLGSDHVTATYGIKEYNLHVRYVGNDVWLDYFPSGTVIALQ
jgi:hypothetical protein